MKEMLSLWPVGVTAVTTILWFGRLEWMIKNHDSRVTAIESEQAQVSPALAEIKTDIKWIREVLSDLRRQVP